MSMHATRRRNLRAATLYMTHVELSRRLGVTRSYVSQLIGPTPIRSISEASARKFEKRLTLKKFSLDK